MERQNLERGHKPWWDHLVRDFLKPALDDRRLFRRFQAQFPLRLLAHQEGLEVIGQVINMSAKGLGLVADQPLRPNAFLDLWLKIPDGHEPLYERGRVAWIEPQDMGQYRIGVCFDKVDFMGVGRALRV